MIGTTHTDVFIYETFGEKGFGLRHLNKSGPTPMTYIITEDFLNAVK